MHHAKKPPLTLRFSALIFLTFGFFAFSQTQSFASQDWRSTPWQSWTATLETDHPLVGKIWSRKSEDFVTPDAAMAGLKSADFLLLGEIHDNPDHHRLQAWIISQVATDKTPTVVMEMISEDQREAVKTFFEDDHTSASAFGAALSWDKSGWPAWALYQPIAEAAFDANLMIAVGNPGRDVTRAISKEGLAHLADADRTALALTEPLATPLADALNEELFLSHCELVPRNALGTMADVQRYRDATLAAAMRETGTEGGAILIAGNGHVREDRSVPLYLKAQMDDPAIATVMIIEVSAAGTTPETYPEVHDRLADFIWFTPRAERGDMCTQLRQHFQSKTE